MLLNNICFVSMNGVRLQIWFLHASNQTTLCWVHACVASCPIFANILKFVVNNSFVVFNQQIAFISTSVNPVILFRYDKLKCYSILSNRVHWPWRDIYNMLQLLWYILVTFILMEIQTQIQCVYIGNATRYTLKKKDG